MSSKEYWMRRAIDLARYCHTPYAAILTDQNGKLIAQKANTVQKDMDPTAHAEINVIRKACKLRKSLDLSDCIIYCTVEPSPIGSSAMANSYISSIVYGAGISDVTEHGGRNLNFSISDFYQSINYEADITPYYLRDECTGLIAQFT